MASKQTILTFEEAVEKVCRKRRSRHSHSTSKTRSMRKILKRTIKTFVTKAIPFLKIQKELWKCIKQITGPIMKKLCSNLSDMLNKVQVFVKLHSRKKNRNCLLEKKTNLKKLQESELEQLSESHSHLLFLEPVELFRLFVNNKICEMIHCKTERYAAQKNQLINIFPQEIETGLAIIILTVYNSHPRQRLYWSKDDDVTCSVVSQSMARKRFEDIKMYLHFIDSNKLQIGKKLAKIQSLQDKVNRSLQNFGVFLKDLSIDEQMVPYFGRHFFKMFIRGKPIRFG